MEGAVKQRGALTRREVAGEGGDKQDNTRHNVSVGGTREQEKGRGGGRGTGTEAE
jgi:hypothetical protein